MRMTGWGRYPSRESAVLEPDDFGDVAKLHSDSAGLVARGNGRAYGDAAIGLTGTLLTRRLDRIISFDPATGRLEVEAGVLLADILDFAVPRGFFPPVVPGTFYAVGLNYLGHTAEAGQFLKTDVKVPKKPDVGYRASSALIAHDDAIVIPAGSSGMLPP